MRWVWHVAPWQERCMQSFGGRYGKRPLERRTHRWKHNTKRRHQRDVEWNYLAQDKSRWHADECGNETFPIKCGEFLGYLTISGFRRDVDEICRLLGYYAAYIGNFLPTFRDNVGPIFKDCPSNGTDRLSANVSKELPTTMRCVICQKSVDLSWGFVSFTGRSLLHGI